MQRLESNDVTLVSNSNFLHLPLPIAPHHFRNLCGNSWFHRSTEQPKSSPCFMDKERIKAKITGLMGNILLYD